MRTAGYLGCRPTESVARALRPSMLLLPAVDDEEQLSADRTARDEESSSRTSNIGERQKKHHGQQYNPVGPAFDDADEQELDGRKPTRLKFYLALALLLLLYLTAADASGFDTPAIDAILVATGIVTFPPPSMPPPPAARQPACRAAASGTGWPEPSRPRSSRTMSCRSTRRSRR